MHSRVVSRISNDVPDFVVSSLSNEIIKNPDIFDNKKQGQTTNTNDTIYQDEAQEIMNSSIDHGFGIYEDKDGSIWYKEEDSNGKIYIKKSIDESEETELVSKYLDEKIKSL